MHLGWGYRLFQSTAVCDPPPVYAGSNTAAHISHRLKDAGCTQMMQAQAGPKGMGRIRPGAERGELSVPL
jgi:hypothetical protein